LEGKVRDLWLNEIQSKMRGMAIEPRMIGKHKHRRDQHSCMVTNLNMKKNSWKKLYIDSLPYPTPELSPAPSPYTNAALFGWQIYRKPKGSY
jgi:hypothetical protein